MLDVCMSEGAAVVCACVVFRVMDILQSRQKCNLERQNSNMRDQQCARTHVSTHKLEYPVQQSVDRYYHPQIISTTTVLCLQIPLLLLLLLRTWRDDRFQPGVRALLERTYFPVVSNPKTVMIAIVHVCCLSWPICKDNNSRQKSK